MPVTAGGQPAPAFQERGKRRAVGLAPGDGTCTMGSPLHHPYRRAEVTMVKIVTDTTAALSRHIAERYGIPVIPQVVSFGNESYLEGIDLDIAGFMERLRSSSELPKTAAPPVRLFVEAFERLVPSGEPIVCIHPSALVSGTVRSATVAAAEFPGADIRVIDTRIVASPMATMVELAARWAEEGVGADTIVARLESMSRRCRIYFLVATLEYLAKGGASAAPLPCWAPCCASSRSSPCATAGSRPTTGSAPKRAPSRASRNWWPPSSRPTARAISR